MKKFIPSKVNNGVEERLYGRDNINFMTNITCFTNWFSHPTILYSGILIINQMGGVDHIKYKHI